MKTMIGTVLVVASLATAANAAAPDPAHCRKAASLAQTLADSLDNFRRQLVDATAILSPPKEIRLSPEAAAGADDARVAVMGAVARYRDALDTVAAEYRACKPRN